MQHQSALPELALQEAVWETLHACLQAWARDPRVLHICPIQSGALHVEVRFNADSHIALQYNALRCPFGQRNATRELRLLWPGLLLGLAHAAWLQRAGAGASPLASAALAGP